MRRVFAAVPLLLGAALLCWAGYDLLIARQKVFQGGVKALVLAIVIGCVGVGWLRGKRS
jgi:hypothetical protein